ARFSADGTRIAYALSSTHDEERFEIWIGEVAGKHKVRLPFSGSATAPRWSPVANRLAFVGDRRLYVADLKTLEISQPLTCDELCVQGAPSWSPHGERLAVSLLRHRSVQGAPRIRSNQYRADGIGYLDTYQQWIYEVDLRRSTTRCLASTDAVCSQPEWSPCG